LPVAGHNQSVQSGTAGPTEGPFFRHCTIHIQEATMAPLMDSDELAAWLNCSRTKVYKMAREGMPCFRLGAGTRSEYRFSKDKVENWLKGCVTANCIPVKHAPRRRPSFEELFGERVICRD
jgi:excisionase family DNA binding protein